MHLPRWGHKPIKSAYDILLSPFASGLDDSTYATFVATFVGTDSDATFSNRFRLLYSRERFRKVFNSSVRSVEEIGTRKLIRDKVKISRMAEMYRLILVDGLNVIQDFYKARREFEKHLLLADFGKAHAVLDSFVTAHGESLWAIRSRVILFKYEGRVADMERFCAECKQRARDPFCRNLINCMLLLGSDPLWQLRRQIATITTELREVEYTEWEGLYSLMFVPRPLAGPAESAKCFSVIQSLPLVDQASLLEAFFAEAVGANGEVADPTGFIDFFREQRAIATGIDPEEEGAAVLDLVQAYEEGREGDLWQLFEQVVERMSSPLAMVSLLAKATAHGTKLPERIANSPFGEVIALLAKIHRLEDSPRKLEESFLEHVVSLNSLSDSVHLQLALCKALPHKYSPAESSWLARTANILSMGTPLTSTYAQGGDAVLGHRYFAEDERLPEHRKLKEMVRSERDQRPRSEIDRLLQRYHELALLEKDWLELAASYYLAIEDYPKLISLVADALAVNGNAYVALPMRSVVDYIEAARPPTLEAVVILHVYATQVDVKKEHLLYELYEDFLMSFGVERPRELLTKLASMDSRLGVALLRDVSSLTTMDCLGCFTSSNELRSERVYILDSLRERGLICPQIHQREVDEIIEDVVVDTAATEFSANKIDVNTSALKQFLIDDVAALLAVYRADSGEGENKSFKAGVLLEGPGQSDRLITVIAGDRNVTVLRLLTTVRDAFLFDERYGLDKNLSTEIRHGFLSNQLRARLEDAHLLTEIDEEGRHKPVAHWRDQYSLISETLLNEIDAYLASFSEKFNGLMLLAQSWMKVTVDPADANSAFRYPIVADLVERSHAAARDMSVEEFIDHCFDRLWRQTDACLTDARERINVELTAAIDESLEELKQSISGAKQRIGLRDLIRAIDYVRNDIRSDLMIVSEWFRRSENAVQVTRPLPELVEIAIECFLRVWGVGLRIVRGLPSELYQVSIEGQHVKAFVVALVNLLENCRRRSGLGAQTRVALGGAGEPSHWSLRISNSMSVPQEARCTPEYMLELDARMRAPSSLDLMRAEGGSGLSKVFNQLRLISEGFNVVLSVADGYFNVEIRYVRHGTAGRGQSA